MPRVTPPSAERELTDSELGFRTRPNQLDLYLAIRDEQALPCH